MITLHGKFDEQTFITSGQELKQIRHKYGTKWSNEWTPERGDYKILDETNIFNFGGILIPVKHFMEISRTFDKDERVTLTLDVPRQFLILKTETSKTIIKQQSQAKMIDEIIIDLKGE